MAKIALTREAVMSAIAEFDRLGRDTFLDRYGFGKSREYVLLSAGREYDSKAIVGVAHQFTAGGRALRPDEFSGGQNAAAAELRRLGFEVLLIADRGETGWIFQANPKRFHVSEFIASEPAESEWLVSRYAKDVRRQHQ